MKRYFMAALMAVTVLTASSISADARPRHHRHYVVSYEEGQIVSHPAGCPRRAFCGCGASVEAYGHPVRDLFLASNWFKFPSTSAAPGMAAVRRHHVFIIRSVNGDGTVMAYDANSGGGKTRIHSVSLRGYSVRNPHAGSMASRAQQGT